MGRVKTTVEISDASWRGRGLQPGVSTEWERLRQIVYEGHGG